MIRLITCLKRREDIGPEEFREFWRAPRFDELIEQVVAVSGAELFAKNLTLTVSANQLLMQERGLDEPFDGVLEYWWHDAAHFETLYNDPRSKAVFREMQDYQQQFADIPESVSFFTESN
jgi:hypothetical protein